MLGVDSNTEWSSFQRYLGVPRRGPSIIHQHKLHADWVSSDELAG